MCASPSTAMTSSKTPRWPQQAPSRPVPARPRGPHCAHRRPLTKESGSVPSIPHLITRNCTRMSACEDVLPHPLPVQAPLRLGGAARAAGLPEPVLRLPSPGKSCNPPSGRTRRLPAKHGRPSPQASLLVLRAPRPAHGPPPTNGTAGTGRHPGSVRRVGGPEAEKVRRQPQICLIGNRNGRGLAGPASDPNHWGRSKPKQHLLPVSGGHLGSAGSVKPHDYLREFEDPFAVLLVPFGPAPTCSSFISGYLSVRVRNSGRMLNGTGSKPLPSHLSVGMMMLFYPRSLRCLK